MKLLKKKLSLLTCILIILIQYNAKAQHYYLLNEGDMLMISAPKDIKFSSIFPGEGLYTAQLGYSPIKHLSLVGSFIHDKTSRTSYSFIGPFERISRGFNLNAAVGSYFFLKSKKALPERFFLSKNVTMDQGFLFDIYAGVNYGKIHNFYEGISQSHFDTNKFYVQLGAHWAFRIGTLSYAFRAVYLDYSNGRAQGDLQEEDLRDLFDGGIKSNDPFSFYESSFRYSIGIRQVRIYTGVSTKHQKDNIRPNDARRVSITAGMIFELDEIFTKKEKPTKE